jgi:hypothetical protein
MPRHVSGCCSATALRQLLSHATIAPGRIEVMVAKAATAAMPSSLKLPRKTH